MTFTGKTALRAGLMGGALALMAASPALAADFGGTYKGSYKDAPVAPPPSKIEFSASTTLTTDYVFRGFSQTDENPAVQGTVGASYKWFYVGAFASNLDFGGTVDGGGSFVDVANLELDLYGGIQKSFNGVNFKVGVIQYAYPNAYDKFPGPGANFGNEGVTGDLDYTEITAGVSSKIFYGIDAGFTGYYSPDYTADTGDVITLEGTLSKEFSKIWIFTPTVSGLLGYVDSIDDNNTGKFVANFASDDYFYWNAGVSLGFADKFAIDLRYWDTDVSDNVCENATLFQCDARFVASLTASF